MRESLKATKFVQQTLMAANLALLLLAISTTSSTNLYEDMEARTGVEFAVEFARKTTEIQTR